MVNDPIGDMIIQIKNAKLAGRKMLEIPYSKMKFSLGKIMQTEGYLESVEKSGNAPKLLIRIGLKYHGKEAVLTDVKRKSKPGRRIYIGKKEIPQVIGGMGTAILSTPEGLLTGKDAKKRGIGGEFVCEIW